MTKRDKTIDLHHHRWSPSWQQYQFIYQFKRASTVTGSSSHNIHVSSACGVSTCCNRRSSSLGCFDTCRLEQSRGRGVVFPFHPQPLWHRRTLRLVQPHVGRIILPFPSSIVGICDMFFFISSECLYPRRTFAGSVLRPKRAFDIFWRVSTDNGLPWFAIPLLRVCSAVRIRPRHPSPPSGVFKPFWEFEPYMAMNFFS